MSVKYYSGTIEWSATKSLWLIAMSLGAIIAIGWHFNLFAMGVAIFLSGITLSFGLSVGLHRGLIHHSFNCPLWLERCLVYLGTLVGMGGPLSLVNNHNLRDWMQRQPQCDDFFSHRRSLLMDGWWQLHCKMRLAEEPPIEIDQKAYNDRFYKFLEATWMFHQIPLAFALYLMGGIDWVLWGICVRVTACVTTHWLICYIAHNHGHQSWKLTESAVQGYDVPFLGLLTMGECWHNCHHAFPHSAKLGLLPGQTDPGWWIIKILHKFGLVWDIKIATLHD